MISSAVANVLYYPHAVQGAKIAVAHNQFPFITKPVLKAFLKLTRQLAKQDIPTVPCS